MRKAFTRLPWRAAVGIAIVLGLAACTRSATTRPLPTAPSAGQTSATSTSLPPFLPAQQTAVVQTSTARARLGSVTPAPTAAITPKPPTAVPASPTAVPVQPTAVPTAPATTGQETYTIQPGDTLFSIAQRFGLTVEELAQANNIADPSSIEAGQVLTIPARGTAAPTAAGGQRTYTVQPGDTCFRIALTFNLTCEQLAAANPDLTPPDYVVYPGQVLTIP